VMVTVGRRENGLWQRCWDDDDDYGNDNSHSGGDGESQPNGCWLTPRRRRLGLAAWLLGGLARRTLALARGGGTTKHAKGAKMATGKIVFNNESCQFIGACFKVYKE